LPEHRRVRGGYRHRGERRSDAASKGMFASVPGKKLVSALKMEVEGPVELYAPYAGQAAEVVLKAISAASGARAGVIAAVDHAKVKNGITGNFDILPSGDPSVGPITISRASKTSSRTRSSTPAPSSSPPPAAAEPTQRP
jgi:ABC-type branched-subunit amino acid transport system substrate-binding protein